jgi:hypothetical protein
MAPRFPKTVLRKYKPGTATTLRVATRFKFVVPVLLSTDPAPETEPLIFSSPKRETLVKKAVIVEGVLFPRAGGTHRSSELEVIGPVRS